MKFKAAKLALVLLIFGASTDIFAFKTHPKIHQAITRLAILNIGYDLNGATLFFTDQALRELVDANIDVDTESLKEDIKSYLTGGFYFSGGLIGEDYSFLHFDNEDLDKSRKFIKNSATYIIDLMEDSPWENAELARHILGTALHPLQDFYSHSNWVDLGRTDEIVNFFHRSDFSEFTVTDTVIGNVCVSFNPGQVLRGARLSTGYYLINPPDNLDKCDHGNPLDCNAIGINADLACRGNKFGDAWRLARRESAVFIQSIVNEIASEGGVSGVCALMGIKEENCEKREPEEEPPSTTGPSTTPPNEGGPLNPSAVFAIVDVAADGDDLAINTNTSFFNPGGTYYDVEIFYEGAPEFPVTVTAALLPETRYIAGHCGSGRGNVDCTVIKVIEAPTQSSSVIVDGFYCEGYASWAPLDQTFQYSITDFNGQQSGVFEHTHYCDFVW